MIKAVSFDLWFTVFRCSLPYDDNVRQYRINQIYEIFTKKGMQESLPRFQKKFDDVSHIVDAQRNRFGKENAVDMTSDAQIQMFLEEIVKQIKFSDSFYANLEKKIPRDLPKIDWIRTAFIEPILKFPPNLADGTKDILLWLQKHQIKSALVSNTGKTP
jgi:hypothetical protein